MKSALRFFPGKSWNGYMPWNYFPLWDKIISWTIEKSSFYFYLQWCHGFSGIALLGKRIGWQRSVTVRKLVEALVSETGHVILGRDEEVGEGRRVVLSSLQLSSVMYALNEAWAHCLCFPEASVHAGAKELAIRKRKTNFRPDLFPFLN